ncbi:MAG: cystatin domain-containing protein [Asticcacaulis sp.]
MSRAWATGVVGLALLLAVAPSRADESLRPVIAGGYSASDPKSKDVRKAVAVALSQKAAQDKGRYSLEKVYSAETQVVAGLNYRLCLRVRAYAAGHLWPQTRHVAAVVYRDLSDQWSLTDWQVVAGCSGGR